MKLTSKQRTANERKIGISIFMLFQSAMLILALLAAFALSSVAHAADTTDTNAEQPEVNPEENYILEPIGAKKMLLEVGEEFVDPGAVLLDENRNLLYMFYVYSDEVTILDPEGKRHPELEAYCSVSGKVATETEGEYLRKITYKDKSIERLITVLENPEEGLYKPEGDVELFFNLVPKGDTETIVKSGTKLKDPGVEVYDQFWIRHEKLEKEVKTIGEVDTKQIKYYLWQYDLNGETINCIFRVVSQKEALTLRLDGKKEFTIVAGQTFEIERAKAYTKGGIRRKDLDKDIVIRGTVNTLKPGDYTIIQDLDGVTITILVHVDRANSKTDKGNTETSSTESNTGNSSGGNSNEPSPGPSPDEPGPGPGPSPVPPEEVDPPVPPDENDDPTKWEGSEDPPIPGDESTVPDVWE